MYKLSLDDAGRGPMKSTPTWYQGDFTGMGCSSGLVIVILRFIFWQMSQCDICDKGNIQLQIIHEI